MDAIATLSAALELSDHGRSRLPHHKQIVLLWTLVLLTRVRSRGEWMGSQTTTHRLATHDMVQHGRLDAEDRPRHVDAPLVHIVLQNHVMHKL